MYKDKMLEEALWNLADAPNKMWSEVSPVKKCIKNIKEVLGESKKKSPTSKETWWWNDEVQVIIKTKKNTFALVAKMNFIRTVPSFRLAKMNDKLHVHNAFHHGNLEKKVYMDIPPRFPSHATKWKVRRLKKVFYIGYNRV